VSARDPEQSRRPPVDNSLYDEAYFLGECEGYVEFAATGGRVLSRRLAAALEYADVRPGMRVLDVGCGRGEGLVWLMGRGAEAWGLDYATEALRLTTRVARSAGLEQGGQYCLLAANARRLPLPADSFDRVLMLDIVEHLQPWELEQALREVRRVLKRGGKLLVHTAPNRWYYQFGYPLFRLAERLRGVRLPEDPRRRFRYHRYVHVNEQSPRSLARALRQVGLRPRVWVVDTQQRWANRNRLVRALGWFVTRCYPFKWVFCGEVLSVADRI